MKSDDINNSFKVIDALRTTAHHNSTLTWAGVTRAVTVSGAGFAVVALVLRESGENLWLKLLLTAIILAAVYLLNKFQEIAIVRNMEFTLKYNIVLSFLENKLAEENSDSFWSKLLFSKVYDGPLKGKEAEAHNKRVVLAVPRMFQYASLFGVMVSLIILEIVIVQPSLWKWKEILLGLFIIWFVYWPLRKWATSCLLSRLEKGYKSRETEWRNECEKWLQGMISE